jgi:hypothetical protein
MAYSFTRVAGKVKEMVRSDDPLVAGIDVRLTGSDRAERFGENATHRVSERLKKRDLKLSDSRQINGLIKVSGS